jgi:hypothetical protein
MINNHCYTDWMINNHCYTDWMINNHCYNDSPMVSSSFSCNKCQYALHTLYVYLKYRYTIAQAFWVKSVVKLTFALSLLTNIKM